MPMTLTLSPQVKVTTQTVLGSRLLRLTEADVEEAVAHELVDNPALERIDETWSAAPAHSGWEDHRRRECQFPLDGRDVGDVAEHIAAPESTLDQLIQQARLLIPPTDFPYVVYLIYCLNEHGFLPASRDELAQELHLSAEGVERAIGW